MSAAQMELDLQPLVAPEYEAHLTLAERYQAFIAANPSVLDAFERVAGEWLDAGNARVGMKAVAEQIRWSTGIRLGSEGWRVNNSFVAFIARDLIARRPEWHDRIETRAQKAAA